MEKTINGLDYETFVNIIQHIPSCIFFKDTELRYMFSTQLWEQLENESIVGKTDLEIRKDKGNAQLAMEADKNILKTGEGCRYVIKSVIDGHISYLELIKEPVFDDTGKCIGLVGLINDVTEKTILVQKYKEATTIDSLTGLLNRSAGTEIICNKISEGIFNKTFCLLDIDKFKDTNDKYGHKTGDMILKEFGRILRECVFEEDVVMRLGGVEFVVLLDNVVTKEPVEEFVDKLNDKLSSLKLEGFDGSVSVSIGVKHMTEKTDFDKLYSAAYKAMYEAKQEEGNSYVIWQDL